MMRVMGDEMMLGEGNELGRVIGDELRLVMEDGFLKGKGEAGLLRNTIAEVLYTHAK